MELDPIYMCKSVENIHYRRLSMAKKKLIAKVSEETGVDQEDLSRLSIEALNKLDELKADEDLLGSDPIKESIQVKKVLLGYHPITGAEVWSK